MAHTTNWEEVLQLNPSPKITTHQIGRGNHRLVIADDYYRYPEQVVDLAHALTYVAGAHGSFPGTRAVVSLDTRPLISAVSEIWGAKLESTEFFHPVIFSSILNNGARLTNAQRQPHLDPGITAMVYLNSPDTCAGGTALYRHRLTGLERMPYTPTAEIAALAQHCGTNPESLKTPQGYTAFQDHIIFHPLFAAAGNNYLNDGNEFWEMLFLVEMKFNRMVVIDGRIFHSQHIKPDQFTRDHRLTQALYLKQV